MTTPAPRSMSHRDSSPSRHLHAGAPRPSQENHSDGTASPPRWTSKSWEVIRDDILRQCRHELRFRPDLDPADACQDVLVVMLGRNFAKGFEPRHGPFEAYLAGVVHRVCLRAMRARRMPDGEDAIAGVPVWDSPARGAEHAELTNAIRRVQDGLSAEARAAIDRAGHPGRPIPGRRRTSAEYGRDFRLRRGLQEQLQGHRPR